MILLQSADENGYYFCNLVQLQKKLNEGYVKLADVSNVL